MIKKEIIDHFKKLPGAISVYEAVALYMTITNECKIQFTYGADLGSYAGKSSCIGSAALSEINACTHFFLVDPLYGDKDDPYTWRHTRGGNPRSYHFDQPNANEIILADASKFSKLIHSLEGVPSVEFLEKCPPLGYVFIDTDDHSEVTITGELAFIKNKLLPGGIIGFHDYGNQCTAIILAANKLVSSGEYEQLEIDWLRINQLADELGGEEGNDTWQNYPDIKKINFLGCIRKR